MESRQYKRKTYAKKDTRKEFVVNASRNHRYTELRNNGVSEEVY